MSKRTAPLPRTTRITDLAPLESQLGYTFTDRTLLQLALTHRSYVAETPGVPPETNERMEFLGDAVLAYVTAEYLYRTYPHLNEGELTDLRAALVKAPTLADFARQIQLGSYLLLGKGTEANQGRERDTLLAAGFEAVLGAMILDSGIAVATVFILRCITDEAEKIVTSRRFKDDKSLFQGIVQARLSQTPVYVTVLEEGPSHLRHYEVEVRVGDFVAGRGSGTSKQRAEQEAAHDALAHDGWQSA